MDGTVEWYAGGARCRVCGEGFTGRPVVCPLCEAPHHQDCWNYAGGCATYGCAARAHPAVPRPAVSVGAPASRPPAGAAVVAFPFIRGAGLARVNRFRPRTWPLLAGLALLALTALVVGVPLVAVVLVLLGLGAVGLEACTGDLFVVDVGRNVLVRRIVLWGFEVLEEEVTHLEGVRYLEIEAGRGRDAGRRRCVAALRTGERLPLSAWFPVGGSVDLHATDAVGRVGTASGLPAHAGGAPVEPVAEAVAQAMARQTLLGTGREPGEGP